MANPKILTAHEYRRLVGLPAAGPAQPPAKPVAYTRLPFVIDLPMPPSENALWATARHNKTGSAIRVLTKQARAYRATLAPLFAGLSLDPGKLYRLLWLFCYPWRFKNGKPRVWDAPNRMKFLQDCIATFAGIDDSRFKEPALYERDIDPDQPQAVRIAILPWQQQVLPPELQ
ncbi:MAG: hypothetical protein IT464_12670 [Planctomycetes bacterium]|nr:hypothetical protein [Planctomycetota bacterium]